MFQQRMGSMRAKLAGRRATAVVVLASLALAACVVLLHMRAYSTLSPIDEFQHLDYLDSASRLDPVQPNETVGELAMREEACRGVDSPGFVTPPCRDPELRPEQFQELGINSAATHPPTYYAVTGWAARVVDELPGVSSFLAAGRATGVLWLAAGLALTYRLGRRLGASRSAAAGTLLLLAGTPIVIHSTAVVTNDAPALAIGALVVLTALSVLERRISPAWLVGAAALATSVKVTNLLVVGVVFLMLILARRSGADPDASRPKRSRGAGSHAAPRWGVAAIVVVAGLIPPLVWNGIAGAMAIPATAVPPMVTQFQVPSIGIGEIFGNVFSVVSPVQNAYLPALLQKPGIALLVAVLNLLILTALAAAAWFPMDGRVSQVGLATLVGMLVAGPVFVLLVYVSSHSYFAIPARYGLSLLPAAVAVLACVASIRRWGGVGLVALGTLSVGLVVTSLV